MAGQTARLVAVYLDLYTDFESAGAETLDLVLYDGDDPRLAFARKIVASDEDDGSVVRGDPAGCGGGRGAAGRCRRSSRPGDGGTAAPMCLPLSQPRAKGHPRLRHCDPHPVSPHRTMSGVNRR